MKYIVLFAILLFSISTVFAQSQKIDGWLNLLKDEGNKQVLIAASVEDSLAKYDTTTIVKYINELETKAANKNKRVKARVLALKARLLFYKLGPGDSLYAAEMKKALGLAYELDDEFMVAEFSRWYGEMQNSLKNRAEAAQYCINSIKLQEQAGVQYFPSVKTFYFVTGEMLFKTRNYAEAIPYYQKGLALTDEKTSKDFIANSMNTMAKCYYLTKKYDSSVFYYSQCMQYAQRHKDEVREDWYYASSDNRFEPYLELKQYDSCRKIADELYNASLPFDSAGLTGAAYMYARIRIRNQQFNEGLKWSLQSEQYGRSLPRQTLIEVFNDVAFCYEKLGQKEKALNYYRLNKKLTDERDSVTKNAGAAYLNAQSDFIKTELGFKKLQKEKNRQIFWRNTIIGFAILLSILVISYLLRKKQKTEKQKTEAEKRSALFEEKFFSAEEQLTQFKSRIETYSQKMESLEAALAQKNEASVSTEKIEELSKQIILTEKDWEIFKQNFESVYPGFFTRLKTRFPDITTSELRMAGLIRLNFEVKHIASVLGISQNSVHKTRYRLRDKILGGENGQTLEEFISKI